MAIQLLDAYNGGLYDLSVFINDPCAGYVSAASNNGDGTWPITLTAAPSKAQSTVQTRDGTHPTMTLLMQAANDLQPKLPALIGF